MLKKRILSILLIALILLALLPTGAFAANHIIVTRPNTVSVIAGGLADIDLNTVFRDEDDHVLTYTESTPNVNENPSNHIKNGHYYFSASTPGTYQSTVTAKCSGNETASCTFNFTVTEAARGLDEQYGYDETPAESVTVYVTFSSDGIPIVGNDAENTPLARLPVTVPYFDLDNQGLSDCYRYKTDDNGNYIGSSVIERPTLMHLYLYMIGVYYLGCTPEQVTSGEVKINGHKGTGDPVMNILGNTAYTSTFDALYLTGAATSTYMQNFWGHDENLMYYRNHCYPLQRPGWGSTSDYILLSDGDVIDLAMFTNWDFYTHGAFWCFGNGQTAKPMNDFTVKPGELFTVQTLKMGTQDTVQGNTDAFTAATDVTQAAVYNENWELVGNMTASQTQTSAFTYTFNKEGTYYIIAMDSGAGTNDACCAPAMATVTVSEKSALPGDVNGDGYINANDANLILRYDAQLNVTLDLTAGDVNGDGYINANDANLILRYDAQLITEFPKTKITN